MREMAPEQNSPSPCGRGQGEGSSAPPRVLDHARAMRRKPTPPEGRLWFRLRRKQLDGLRFRRQVVMDRYIADFYCPAARLVVEIDGATHVDELHDMERNAWMRSQALRVLRGVEQ